MEVFMSNKLMKIINGSISSSKEVTRDILVMDFTIVTACLVGRSDIDSNKWILVDTGLESSFDYILQAAEKRFGKNNRPQAIILTHGHFDHVGSVIKLSEIWDVPVYIHQLELPYVTGEKDYPLADPTVDEGLIAKMSPLFPHTSIDIGFRVSPLPSDGSIPGMPEWKWIHTPGHTPGHVSLFCKHCGILLAGDAFSTVKQESLMSVITKDEKISGPPKYLTTDWESAESSIKQLEALKPSLVIPSHGKPMKGEELRLHLEMLVNHFNDIAKPKHGRFVNQ